MTDLYCNSCQGLWGALSHWRKLTDRVRFQCRCCKKSFDTEEEAWLIGEKLTCGACKRKVSYSKAWMCPGCYEVGGCCEACWDKIAGAHSCSGACIGLAEGGEEESTDVGARRGPPPSRTKQAQATRRTKPAMTPTKARFMLHEGVVRGHSITERQRKYFGHVASLGRKKRSK
jgi:hypothetical protein